MNKDNNLSSLILLATDQQIQDWLKTVEVNELTQLLLYHLSDNARNLLRRNLSARAVDMLTKKTEDMGKVTDKYISVLGNIIKEDKTKNKNVILFTDLVGSTDKMRIMGDADYYDNILSVHNRVLSKYFNNNAGRIIKEIGDAFLVTFITPDSILCCMDIQKELRTINRKRTPENNIYVRMALHYGEIEHKLMSSGIVDIYGTAVNYAARLINKAVGEQIVLSNDMVEFLKAPYGKGPSPELSKAINGIELMGLDSFKGFDGDQKIFTIKYDV